jgi:hypothetical protein
VTRCAHDFGAEPVVLGLPDAGPLAPRPSTSHLSGGREPEVKYKFLY